MPRRKNDAIMEECVSLLYLMEQAAKQEVWERLWQQHIEGKKQKIARPDVFELLTYIGASLAYEQRKFQAVHDSIGNFLRSPQAGVTDYIFKANLMYMQFSSLRRITHSDRKNNRRNGTCAPKATGS